MAVSEGHHGASRSPWKGPVTTGLVQIQWEQWRVETDIPGSNSALACCAPLGWSSNLSEPLLPHLQMEIIIIAPPVYYVGLFRRFNQYINTAQGNGSMPAAVLVIAVRNL